MWDSVTYIRMFSYFVFVEDGASKSHYHHLLKETNGYGDKIEYPRYWMANTEKKLKSLVPQVLNFDPYPNLDVIWSQIVRLRRQESALVRI